MDGEVELNEDEDVVREREAVRSREDGDYALAVRDVYKYYGDFCAVRGLTFGVRQTDCFGLLGKWAEHPLKTCAGVNGAGKTTTFSILTSEMFATAGRATVSGVNVVDRPVVGYCPQFDALAKDLTGRETLTLLGRLNGFADVPGRVAKVLDSIRMTQQADKLVQFYSGGQRRRLSIGVTLMARTSFIMLDEPTAGIDPSTRRRIWQLIQAVKRQNVALLLTSHSMDECEALCNRIGFMNKGSLISIGSSQHLKSRCVFRGAFGLFTRALHGRRRLSSPTPSFLFFSGPELALPGTVTASCSPSRWPTPARRWPATWTLWSRGNST